MLSRRLGGGSRDRRLMAETTRAFRCLLGSREPEAAPLGGNTYPWADTKTGACNISRSLARASALLFRGDAPSIARCGLLLLVRGTVAGAERSPHAPAPWGSESGPRLDLLLSACAGGLPEWNDPRPRQPLRVLEAGRAPPYTSSHRIFWFGRGIFSSRPARHRRRRAQPPSRPALFRAAAGLVLPGR